MQTHDLIVIGGGAGGISAADAALRRGARTLVVQDGPMGGDCTFTGCVPSKALIAAAARGASAVDALAAADQAVREVAATEDADTFRARGATVVEGRARFVDDRTIEVDGTRHRADRFVVATGASPLIPPIDGLAESEPLTSDSLWDLDDLPASLVVLGGGAIGVELAQAFGRLGVSVTVFEAADRILGTEEPEVSALLTGRLRAEGIDVRVGEAVESVRRTDDGVTVASGRSEAVASGVLAAIGRRPVTSGLQLDRAGVAVEERGAIQTDDRLRTTADGIFAVGDATGRFPFTHGAYAQGLVAVGNALGPVAYRRFSSDAIPYVVFTDPEVAHVGTTEANAYERWGNDAQVVEFPMSALDRAITEGRTEGFVKLVAKPGRVLRHRAGGQLVGATIVAPRAGELIHEIALAMKLRLPPAAIALSTHAYPTWGMAVQQAASAFFLESESATRRPARPA